MKIDDVKTEDLNEDTIKEKDSTNIEFSNNSDSISETSFDSNLDENNDLKLEDNLDLAINSEAALDINSDIKLENTSDLDIDSDSNLDNNSDLNIDSDSKLDNNSNSDDSDSQSNPNFDTVSNTSDTHSHNLLKIVGVFFGVFFVVLIIIFGVFSIYNYLNNSTIAKGVYIYGVDVSKLTQAEAKEKISSHFSNLLSNDITLVHNDYTTYIKTADIDLSFNVDSIVNEAYQFNKGSNIFVDDWHTFNALINGINITPKITYERSFLEAIIDNISSELPDAVVNGAYYIEDNNLIVTKGHAGVVINMDATCDIIDKKISDLSFLNEAIELKTETQEPKQVDLQQVRNEIYKDPKDAYFTTEPYMVYPSSTGIDFKISIEEATTLLANSEQECTIPLKTLYPNVTTNMLGQEAFPDKLASFSTKYVANADRTTNLRLAANKINGTVLLPGETFSYNSTVGARTISAGYKEAAIYQNGEVVQGVGGGICQISTTLYNAVLFANLEIVELHNHQFVPSYVSAGRDATVVYGAKDFKFKNTRNYPIKINCSVANGTAYFEIKGLREETEYEVSVYANVNSRTSSYIKSSTYRTLKQNGAVIKTENIINSTYKVH